MITEFNLSEEREKIINKYYNGEILGFTSFTLALQKQDKEFIKRLKELGAIIKDDTNELFIIQLKELDNLIGDKLI